MSSTLFRWPIRVYYEDTDTAGIVYYANYLKFFERARTEWLRALGWGQHALAGEHGLAFVVAQASVDYRRPARLDDELVVEAAVVQLGRASLTFEQRAWRGAELLASARVRVGCIRAADYSPAPMPAAMLAAMKPLLQKDPA
ncbi:MAG TPA: tol-pal system-associated acyl-CoA thioesterase [Burkholderiaceae bacterium]|jgi:acyl-CoA thioester hydrolase|nr:tol-pal system-associated acyl-CoA thioesterase [Burkholderiaceae bacterium]HRY99969.1 tol-pal system-associated acyl-CoA thioesterase [Burkholderiaceae bacterium]